MGTTRAEYVQVERATTGHDYIARRSIGSVEAIETVRVRSAVEGFLTEIAVKEGSTVKRGDVLFRIDPLRYEAALQKAQAELDRIDARIIYATNSHKRLAELADRKAASREDADSALASLEELKAGRAGAQADLVKARKDLDDCTIRAEISGKIGRVNFTGGNYITVGEELATVVQLDPIYVRFPLSQYDVDGVFGSTKRIRNSTDVRLYTASGKEYPTAGSIDILDNQVSETTDSYTLWAKFDNPDGVLMPSGIGALLVRLTDTVEVPMVPLTAVHHDTDGSFVYTVGEDGTVARRDVISGSIRGRLQSIYEGVTPGEVVITDGAHKTRVGAKVIPVYPEEKKQSAEKTKAQNPEQEAVPVRTARPKMIADPTVIACDGARVEAVNRIELRPLVQGILTEQAFKDGDRVEKGDVLFRIDPTRYQAAVDAQVSKISVLSVRIADAERRLQRQERLLTLNATSKDEYESAKAARAELAAEKTAAEAELRVAQDNLSRCTVKARLGGRIGRVNFSKGTYVADMKSPLATLVQLSPIYVRFHISESEILSNFGNADKLVEDAEITLVTATGQSLKERGVVAFCDNMVHPDTDTMNVWACFENESHALRPGGVVTIRVVRKADKPVPAIPADAVQTDTRGCYAYVLRHGRACLVRLHCGTATTDGLVPVYSGVSEEDEVITSNFVQLEDGTLVTTVQE